MDNFSYVVCGGIILDKGGRCGEGGDERVVPARFTWIDMIAFFVYR